MNVAGGESTRASAAGPPRPLGWAAIALAVWQLALVCIERTTAYQALIQRRLESGAAPLGYDLVFGGVAALLWLFFLVGIFTMSRQPAGRLLMASAVAVVALSSMLSNVWPALESGTLSIALKWLASLLSLAGIPLFVLGIVRLGVLNRLASGLVVVWGVAGIALTATVMYMSSAFGSGLPLGWYGFSRGVVNAKGLLLPLLMTLFLLAAGRSLLRMDQDRQGAVRLTKAST